MGSYVYHGSPTQGLTRLDPHPSAEGRPCVYASRSKVVAALFLGRFGGDLTCQLGVRDGIPYVVERYPGALRDRYENPGSIYVLPDDTFVRGSRWSPEWVSFTDVAVYREQKIDCPLDYLLTLEKQDRLLIYRFPDTGPRPHHERDLVAKYARLIQRGGRRGQRARLLLETKRPDLHDRVMRRLDEV